MQYKRIGCHQFSSSGFLVVLFLNSVFWKYSYRNEMISRIVTKSCIIVGKRVINRGYVAPLKV